MGQRGAGPEEPEKEPAIYAETLRTHGRVTAEPGAAEASKQSCGSAAAPGDLPPWTDAAVADRLADRLANRLAELLRFRSRLVAPEAPAARSRGAPGPAGPAAGPGAARKRQPRLATAARLRRAAAVQLARARASLAQPAGLAGLHPPSALGLDAAKVAGAAPGPPGSWQAWHAQEPAPAPPMCLLQHADGADMLAVLCTSEKQQPFQGAVELCRCELGLDSTNREVRLEFSYAEPRRARFDQIRQALGDAGGRWSELAPGINMCQASWRSLRAVGLGYSKKQLQRAGCIALVLERRRRGTSSSQDGHLSLCLGAVHSAPRFLLEPVRAEEVLGDDDDPAVKEEGGSASEVEPMALEPPSGPEEEGEGPQRGAQPAAVKQEESPPPFRRMPATRRAGGGVAPAGAPPPPRPPPPHDEPMLRFAKGRQQRARRQQGLAARSRQPLAGAAPWRGRSRSSRRSRSRSGRRGPRPAAPVRLRARSAPRGGRSVSPAPRITGITIDGARVDETATIDDVLNVLRPRLTGGVKEEGGEEQEEQVARGLSSTQLTMLRQLASDGWRHDPSHGGDVLRSSGHLLCDLSVERLRHTHQLISSTFRLGEHCGMRVMDLVQMLVDGRVRDRDIVPLVVVKLEGKLWVVHGNRRLWALKEFQRRVAPRRVLARCILHNARGPEGVPHAVMAKLLLHASTQTDGRSAEFGRRPR